MKHKMHINVRPILSRHIKMNMDRGHSLSSIKNALLLRGYDHALVNELIQDYAKKPEVKEQTKNSNMDKYGQKLDKVKKEIGKMVIGQEDVVDGILRAVISRGHVLLEGVPGLAKTLLIRTFASVVDTTYNRIQFTPDLLPTDIIGVTVYHKDKGFEVVKGPVFSNFILGDEINRAPPKVQSALLEAMGEKQVTIGKITYALPDPFFVLATQNPIESIGTYPLPSAQVDRFLFKLKVEYPLLKDEKQILENNITTRDFKSFKIHPVMSSQDLIGLQNAVHGIYLDENIRDYILRIVDATRNWKKYNLSLGKYIEYGGSPRSSIGMYIAAKAEAMLRGKSFVVPEYVKKIVYDVLRHRIIVNYEGQAENITSEQVITDILNKVEVP